MNWQELLQQIQDQLKHLWEKIQESSTYQQLIEKYEDQSPITQRVIQAGVAFVVIILLLIIPISNILSSSNYSEEFQTRRELIRELLKVSRDASQVVTIPQGPDPDFMVNQVKTELQGMGLLPEQISSVRTTDASTQLIKKEFIQGAIEVNVLNLNTRQIVDIAYNLSRISPSAKFTQLNLTASPQNPGYFHLSGKLISLKVPQLIIPRDEEKTDKKGDRKNKNRKEKEEE